MNGFATPHTQSPVTFRLVDVKSALKTATNFLGTKTRRKIAHNTYLLNTNGVITIRLHNTDVLTIAKDKLVLNSGGYRTHTTKGRLNDLLPPGYSLCAENGLWYLATPSEIYTYADGITITSKNVKNQGNADLDKALRNQIHKFAKEFAAKAVKGEIDKPSGGDCWFCHMVVSEGKDSGKTLGDVSDNDHLESHMSADEKYFVPSMLLNAVKEDGKLWLLSDVWGGTTHRHYSLEADLRKALRKYLGKRFGLALR